MSSRRDWNKSVLRVFLRKLPFDEVIDHFISIIDHICEKDEDFDQITHDIVTHVQVRDILLGAASNISGYEPKRKLELFKLVLEQAGGSIAVSDAVAENLLKDFEASKKTFSDWWLDRKP